MQAAVWNDYVCPWSYLGRHRTALMEELGVAVRRRPFELHPELPLEGKPVRPGGRLSATYDRVAAECDACGIAFRAPLHSPNTRRTLETVAVVGEYRPDLLEQVDDAVSDARWLDGEDVSDPAVLSAILERVGVDPMVVAADVRDGRGHQLLDASMAEAREAGIASTPSWRFDSGFVIPGVQPVETVTRWVGRIAAKGP